MMEPEKKFPFLSGLTGGFLIFLLCILALIRDPRALDSGQVYRLLVLNVGLLVVLPALLFTSLRRKIHWEALGNRVVLAYALYVVAVWLSLLVALNPSAGLLDACRSGAVLVVICLCLVLFASSPDWRLWLAKSATLAGLACGMVGLYQCYECAVWNAPTRRWLQGITGLMGNVNLFAGYLLMLLPFCIVGVVLLRGFWRFGAVLAAINSFFLIVLLQGRSVWMGAVAVIAVFALAIFIQPKLFGFNSKTRFLIVSGAALFALALTLFLKLSPSGNPISSRMHAVFSEDIRFADGGRLMIWRETLKMFYDHFPFGVGAGNFTLHLQGYRKEGRLDFSQIDSRWNQPHNDYLWILAEKGVLGFITFVVTLILASSNGIRSIFQTRNLHESWVATAALAALAGYLVDSFFSFPLERVNHQTVLAIVLATLAARPETGKRDCFSFGPLRMAIFAGVAFAAVGVGFTIAIFSLNQEHHVALAREAMTRGHWSTMQKHSQLARTPIRTLDTYAVPVSFLEGFALMKKGNLDKAKPLIQGADRDNPDRFYILNNLAVIHAAQGEDQKAGEIFERLCRLYPEEPEAACNLALFLLNQGKTDQALRVIEKVPREKIPHSVLQRFSIPSAGKPD